MRVVKCDGRPEFLLLKRTVIENRYYMQMPLWLFSDPRYANLSLDVRVELQCDPDYEYAPFLLPESV